jgi:hypothetical protein
MFIEFETVKGEKVCVNINNIFLFCKKKENTTLICFGDYMEYEVKGDYETTCKRMQRRDLLFAPSSLSNP